MHSTDSAAYPLICLSSYPHAGPGPGDAQKAVRCAFNFESHPITKRPGPHSSVRQARCDRRSRLSLPAPRSARGPHRSTGPSRPGWEWELNGSDRACRCIFDTCRLIAMLTGRQMPGPLQSKIAYRANIPYIHGTGNHGYRNDRWRRQPAASIAWITALPAQPGRSPVLRGTSERYPRRSWHLAAHPAMQVMRHGCREL